MHGNSNIKYIQQGRLTQAGVFFPTRLNLLRIIWQERGEKCVLYYNACFLQRLLDTVFGSINSGVQLKIPVVMCPYSCSVRYYCLILIETEIY